LIQGSSPPANGEPMDLEPQPLSALFDDYDEQIEALRLQLPNEKQQKVDNLYLLRYLLSYGGPSAAAAAAVVKALEWREAHSALVAAARSCSDEQDSTQALSEFIDPTTLKILDSCLVARFAGESSRPRNFPVYVIQSGHSSLRKLMSHVPGDSVSLWLTWRNEIGHWRCDAASRKSGRLLKQLNIMSLKGCRLMDQDPRFFLAYGRSSSRSEWLHPQLLARQIVVHPPVFMSYFWALGRKLVSKRLLSKVRVYSGSPADHLAEYLDNPMLDELVSSLSVVQQGGPAVDDDVETQTGVAATEWVEAADSIDVFDKPLPENFLPAKVGRRPLEKE